MVASSATFCPHLGRVNGDLFRMLHAVLHGMKALVYSNYHRSVCPYSSGGLSAPYRGSSAQQRCQCSSHIGAGTASAGTDAGHGSLKEPAIECLTLGLSRGMNRVTLSYFYSGDYPTRG